MLWYHVVSAERCYNFMLRTRYGIMWWLQKAAGRLVAVDWAVSKATFAAASKGPASGPGTEADAAMESDDVRALTTA